MKELYYTPEVEEFHIGFEFEAKATFLDGTIKSQEQFNDDIKYPWCKERVTTINYLSYIQRSLHGRNSELNRCGIRVKYLDNDDIESLGFNNVYEDAKLSQFEGNFLNEVTGKKEKNVILIKFKNDLCISVKVRIYDMIDKEVCCLIIKNKSELKKLLNQLGIK